MTIISQIFLANVTVASWQIWFPILVVIGMVIGYILSKFIREHLLFIYTLFLLVFIPLYPKIPLEGVRNTFVYIRLDDIFVALGVFVWLFYLFRKKIVWKSAVGLSIIAYWLIGLVSTISAVIFIFPYLANVFVHDAFLYYLRHIEYLIVFFLAFSSMRSKRYVPWVIAILTITVLLVVGYGFGQAKYPSVFLAFSTMNEEFAKGIPLILQSGGRIQATFAGHYDLAAFLVMLIPVIASMIFGVKNLFSKLLFLLTSVLALILLLMTASRTSFAVYLVAIVVMLILQKKKLWILPVIAVSIGLLLSFHTLSQRFADTLTQQSVVINARTGKAIGIVNQDRHGKLTIVDKSAVGQNVSPGTSYIIQNTSQPQLTTTQITYSKTVLQQGTESAQITNLEGDFVVKKAFAYDDSFTTRFQGEWPRAMTAFLREPFLGSGYSSIGLASDNNYLRMLGETGFLGFASFLFIFLILGIYVYRVLPDVDSQIVSSLAYGTIAGIVGLALNATLIDVFEASKDAYTLWLLIGIMLGALALYQKHKVDYKHDLLILISKPFIGAYLLIASLGLFAFTYNNFFVGDDFTWLRWIADCTRAVTNGVVGGCQSAKLTIIDFFLQSSNFFYRPMEKVYFYLLYNLFGFNPLPFHVVSVLLHWLCVLLIFLLSLRFTKNKLLAFLIAFVFLILSVHAETVLWISASGHLFVAFFTLLAVYTYTLFLEQRKPIYLLVSLLAVFLAPLFHESGVMAAVIVFVYGLVMSGSLRKTLGQWCILSLSLLPLPIYFMMRTAAHSFWSAGDYSYNLSKLPFNLFGNYLGYLLLTVFGLPYLSWNEILRNNVKTHLFLAAVVILLSLFLLVGLFLVLKKAFSQFDQKIFLVSSIFFFLPLLPFVGLGNLAARYDYLASFGILLFLGSSLFYVLKVKLKNALVVRGIIILSIILFGWYNYSQLLNASQQWAKAGSVTQNLLREISNEYQAPGLLPVNPVFYFSNVPQRYGQAWIFNTGLPDAIWMMFQDKNITVKQTPSLSASLHDPAATGSARFYEVDQSGNLTETKRTQTTIIIQKK